MEFQAANLVARYRGGGESEIMTGGESSIDSLDDDEDEEEEESSSTRNSQSSYGTRESVAAAGGTETLPCGATAADVAVSQGKVSTTVNDNQQPKSFQWTLSNWGAAQAARRRNNSGTVRVDLASPEDISLDTDNSSRVVFSAYGTTV